MYFAVAALLILATASPLNAYQIPATGSGELAKEFQDLLDLMSLDDALEITRAYAAKDVEFRAMLRLIGANDAKQLLEFIEDAPEMKEALRYIQNHGLDVYYMINKLNEAFELGPFVPLTMSDREITGGVDGYVTDVASTVSVDEIMELFESKMKKSGPFSDFINFIIQPRFLHFYEVVFKNEHYLALEELAGELGIDSTSFQSYFPLLVDVYAIIHLGLL